MSDRCSERVARGERFAERRKPQLDCSSDEVMTQQHFAHEVDINTICERFGLSPATAPAAAGVYGDFSGITDFESALAAVERARSGFAALPAEVREKYKNDPGRFLRETAEMDDDDLDSVLPARAEPVPDVTLRDVVDAIRTPQAPSDGSSS